jgi:fluoride exporter
MTRILLIGAGGFVGSILRYALSGLVQDAARDSFFPYGTLAVNVLGCLAIGVLGELAEARGAFGVETRALLVVGLLGGFTTFSAFGNETMQLLRGAERVLAAANVLANVILGLAAVHVGRVAAQLVWR